MWMVYQRKTCEKLRSERNFWRLCLRCEAMVQFALVEAKTAFERRVVSSRESNVMLFEL